MQICDYNLKKSGSEPNLRFFVKNAFTFDFPQFLDIIYIIFVFLPKH